MDNIDAAVLNLIEQLERAGFQNLGLRDRGLLLTTSQGGDGGSSISFVVIEFTGAPSFLAAVWEVSARKPAFHRGDDGVLSALTRLMGLWAMRDFVDNGSISYSIPALNFKH